MYLNLKETFYQGARSRRNKCPKKKISWMEKKQRQFRKEKIKERSYPKTTALMTGKYSLQKRAFDNQPISRFIKNTSLN